MVAEHGHGAVGPVVGKHLGGHVVVLLRKVVQLLLQGEGGVVGPGKEVVRRI